MNSERETEERIPDWMSESLTEVSQFRIASLGSSYGGDADNITPSQRNALRLRDCADTADLTALLSKIWTPSSETKSPFELGAGEGTVHDLEVSKVLFFSETICKKLISFIAFPQTSADAKNPAVDVFAWLCTQPALQTSLSGHQRMSSLVNVLFCRFVGSGTICNWLLSLCVNRDAAVSLAGLRGVVKLVSHDAYCKALHDNQKLINIIDIIDLKTDMGRQASTLVFMIFATTINSEGRLEYHSTLIEKLRHVFPLDRSSSMKLKFWGLHCFFSALITSDRRVNLMREIQVSQLAPNSLDASVKDQLFDKCIDAYIAMARNFEGQKSLDVDALMQHKGIVSKVFERLSTQDAVALLKLIAAITGDDPKMIFHDFLEASWPTLLHLLNSDNDRQTLVLDILSSLSRVPVPSNKGYLPGQDHGVHLVKLLAEEITEQRIGILSFLWTHYSDAENAFIKAEVIQSMLALYANPNEAVPEEMSTKIMNLLCSLLNREQVTKQGIQDQMVLGFSRIIGKESEGTSVHNFVSALRGLALCVANSGSSTILRWLSSEGLKGAIRMVTDSHIQSTQNVKSSICSLFETALKSSSKTMDTKYFIEIFVWTLKAVDLCPTSSLAQTIKNHNWSDFKNLKYRDCLDVLSEVVMEEPSLKVLGELIEAKSRDRTGCLDFLLLVLLDCGLRKAGDEVIKKARVKLVLLKLLNQWTITESDKDHHTSQALLLCIGAAQSRQSQQDAESAYSSTSLPILRLWELLIEHGESIALRKEERRAVLLSLKTGVLDLSGGKCPRCHRIATCRQCGAAGYCPCSSQKYCSRCGVYCS